MGGTSDVTGSGGRTSTGGSAGQDAGSAGSGGATGGVIGSGGTTDTGGSSKGGTSGTGGGGTAGMTTGVAGSGGSGGAGGGAGGSAGGSIDGGSSTPAVLSAGCGKTRTLKDGHLNITSSGKARQYWLDTPTDYDSTHPYRLIFTFHCNGMEGQGLVDPTTDPDHNTDQPFYGLKAQANKSAIFVAPDGFNVGWANNNNEDVIFTDDMLAQIEGDLCIDTSRVFTTGFSWGGAMSWKLACVRTDKFRAALVYDAGPVSGNNNAECTKPIPWFQSHGLADGIFNYQNTGIPILNLFAKLNGCTAMTPPQAQTNAHLCVSFEGCSAGYPTRFCNFGSGENNPKPGGPGGHYPSAKDPGQTVSWIPAEAWSFLAQF
jgi:poly(3-hydroxybutyrate) depolymerase